MATRLPRNGGAGRLPNLARQIEARRAEATRIVAMESEEQDDESIDRNKSNRRGKRKGVATNLKNTNDKRTDKKKKGNAINMGAVVGKNKPKRINDERDKNGKWLDNNQLW